MLNDYNELAAPYKATDIKPDKRFSILPTVLHMVGDVRGKTVLDLGCGSGFFSRAFADAGAEMVIGLDASPVQIEEAKKDGRPNAEYRVADVFVEPLPPADVVCVPFILNYLSAADAFLEFLKRVKDALHSGGVAVFVIDVPSGKDLMKYGARKSIHGRAVDGTPITIELFDGMGKKIVELHAFFIALATFERLLREAGFGTVEKIVPIVSDEGTAAFGETYWQEYFADTELGYYRCAA